MSAQIAAQTAQAGWTKPYYGVQHLGEFGAQKNWATVTDRGEFAELTMWIAGCGFRPKHAMFDTAEQARAAGEEWLRSVK